MKEIKNKRIKVRKSLMEKGITLIALVVTIIILLILAGVTLNIALSKNGVIKKAQEAVDKYKNAEDKELTGMSELQNIIDDIINKNEIVTIPEGLSIGDTLIYEPPKSTETEHVYDWKNKYYSSGDEENAKTEDIILKNTENFEVTEWNIFDINEKTGEVTLISKNITKGKVWLGGAQGYNNAVKMLNDACSELYGNQTKGIKARSIKLEDIENKITEEALTEAKEKMEKLYGIAYGNQPETYNIENLKYPSIYAEEKNCVINGEENNDGLEKSQQIKLFEKTYNGATNGLISNGQSIRPYQSEWLLISGNNVSNPATKESFINKNEISYYDIITKPTIKGETTDDEGYWIASRATNTNISKCAFDIRAVVNGVIGVRVLYSTLDAPYGFEFSLRPILTLNSSLIIGSDSEGWKIAE